jgi:hypothetical protein
LGVTSAGAHNPASVGAERLEEFIIRRKIAGRRGSGSGLVGPGGSGSRHDLRIYGPKQLGESFRPGSSVELHRSGTTSVRPDARSAPGGGDQSGNAHPADRSATPGSKKHPEHRGRH